MPTLPGCDISWKCCDSALLRLTLFPPRCLFLVFLLFAFQRSMDPNTAAATAPTDKKPRWEPTNGAAPAPGVASTYTPFAAAGPTIAPHGSAQQGPPLPNNAQLLHSGAAGPALTLNTNMGVIPTGPASAISPSQIQGGLGGGVHLSGAAALHHQQQLASAYPQSAFPSLAAAYQMSSIMGLSPLATGMLGNYGFSPASANFGQTFAQRQLGLSPLAMSAAGGVGGPYSPAAAALAASAAAAGGQTARTVYIGNLPSDASVDELLNLVHFGPIENVRVLPEKSCVFVSFLDAATAAAFHADATVKKLALHGQELKIGWGKPSPVPSQVMLSITQSNASRNVYLGGLPEEMTEEQLRDDMSRFGLIDQVKIVRDKNIGFVHFLSISTATKVVATLPTEAAWAGRRVNYGKDRCAYIPKSQQAAAAAAQVAAAQSLVAQSAAAQLATPLSAAFSGFPSDLNSPASAMLAQSLNRTVYLGNIHPETSTEDLCNAIRGGMLQSIRYMQDKHIAFVTFIDPAAAFSFYQVSTFQGLTLNNRRLKIGWGKNSGPLQPAVALAVHGGATRNVYVGNIEDFEVYSEEKLKRDFGEYGDIELVNYLKEKNCAFVNFTNISNALKAIEGIKAKPDYANLRIAHGKDRCANPPRASSGGQSAGGQLRSARPAGTGSSPTDKDKDTSAKSDPIAEVDETIDEAAILAAVKAAEAEIPDAI
ncbi:hypothetical protein BKA62DRAFT_713501 [Auriculariales sp. MPI-PUGE-AT-0066]|nr:hypothetical protein BKA62DRAFT_713501 [Auriculariales sp. MPI-PUGE-AT-0066]